MALSLLGCDAILSIGCLEDASSIFFPNRNTPNFDILTVHSSDIRKHEFHDFCYRNDLLGEHRNLPSKSNKNK